VFVQSVVQRSVNRDFLISNLKIENLFKRMYFLTLSYNLVLCCLVMYYFIT
jgi:hypothetical protein